MLAKHAGLGRRRVDIGEEGDFALGDEVGVDTPLEDEVEMV